MNLSAVVVFALATTAVATGQTGRTMQQLAPPMLGRTAIVAMTHPTSAAGNHYAFLWSSPPFAGAAPIVWPGLSVNGLARVDPIRFVAASCGLLDASGSTAHSFAVPNDPLWIGLAWDMQSVDLDVAGATLTFADDDLLLRIPGDIPANLNMVAIAAGSFQMGSTQGALTEQPVHTVTLTRPFWMGKYEVTQAEYQAVMGSNPSFWRGPARPVDFVPWTAAMSYCAALTALEAAAGRLPTGYQYRLPTEAEWEYCCRAGTTTEWNVGNRLDCAQANISACVFQTSVVGSYGANAWGLHDMHGNVWEWCLDSWDGRANYPAGAVADPYVTGLPNLVIRGGSWSSDAYYGRSAYRNRGNPGDRDWYLGFRVVLGPVRV